MNHRPDDSSPEQSAADDALAAATDASDAYSVSVRAAAILLVFALLATAMMATVYRATQAPIAASTAQERLRRINEVLAPAEYDNDLLRDALAIPPEPALGLASGSEVLRARARGQPVALIFEAIAPDGYSGAIRLLVGVRADGRLSGVRALEHKETPGLGDYIDPARDRRRGRPWIDQFVGASHAELGDAGFRVRKDGGQFDAVTGATVTARAVTVAVGRAAAWAYAHRAELFAATSSGTERP